MAGQSLRATLEVQGPLTEDTINTGMELQNAVDAFEGGRHGSTPPINFATVVNFEHLNVGELPPEEIAPKVDPNETAEQRRERRKEERKRILEARQRKEAHTRNQKTKVRSEGEPFQWDLVGVKDGWYRFCVKATWNQITAEMDLRKESEFGGVNEDGHVMTFREKVAEDEEVEMEKDTAAMEGIKDEDFKATRDKLRTLRRLLSDIQSKQSQERHRLAVHSATNEHSHSRMALNSLMETILFMAVTGYQVYTIRKWFKGAPVLGR